jgi:hypothetical protein
MLLTHFIVSHDVGVLGREAVITGEPTYMTLANSCIIINAGGGPTDDKPTVTLETPMDPNRVNSFLNIRMVDILALYEEWSARGIRILDAPQTPRDGDPLLFPRPGWPTD